MRGASTSTCRQERARNRRANSGNFCPSLPGYVIAILIGLLLPVVAVAFYFGIAVYLVVPFREVARLLFRLP
jgi:hypothetical protein